MESLTRRYITVVQMKTFKERMGKYEELDPLDTQERLNYIAYDFANEEPIPHLRGIIARLNKKKREMSLTFIFNGEITEELQERASLMATEIFVQFSCDWLDEEYIRIDAPAPLPYSPYLVALGEEKVRQAGILTKFVWFLKTLLCRKL